MNKVRTSFDLAGRRALVTGSSSGIGAAIALMLAQAGADVVIHHLNDAGRARDVADRIRHSGRISQIVEGDFARSGAAKGVFEAAETALGGLDILISNVAVQIPEAWDNVTPEHFETQVRVNWQAAFELVQLAAPSMLERGWGRIVTVGSVQETRPHPQMVVYAALKSAQASMVRNLAKQFAPRGVTVNNLAPGVIETDRNTSRLADPAYLQKVLSAIPRGRLGVPEDCAGLALLLCSDAGSYITGQCILVDGGMSLP